MSLHGICFLAATVLIAAGTPGGPEHGGVRADLEPRGQRKPASEFVLEDSSGRHVRLRDYRGKVVLLDFWATWCHGCTLEIPWFAEFSHKYGEQGVVVVGVSLDSDGWKVVTPFVKTASIPYEIVLGNDSVQKAYGIENMPDTFLIDREGRIAAAYSGLVDKQNVDDNLRVLLSEKAIHSAVPPWDQRGLLAARVSSWQRGSLPLTRKKRGQT
jgi:peroxiredoxin